MLGHLHDGGTELLVRKGRKGKEETVCKSLAGYGEGMTHEIQKRHGGMDMSHIETMSMCHSVGRIEAGEEWSVRADYDLEAHAPMMDASGEPEGVMGIAVMYVVED